MSDQDQDQEMFERFVKRFEDPTDEDLEAATSFVLMLDEVISDGSWTGRLVDDLVDTLEEHEYKIWCDGTALVLTGPGDQTDDLGDYGVAHTFMCHDEDLAERMFETFKAGWALQFGCSPPVDRLLDGPKEPT